MCECGCTANAERRMFPAPGKSFYLLTLSPKCESCDAPPGVSIERIDPGHVLFDDYRRGVFVDGTLQFEKWADTVGVAIVTGHRKHEFVAAVKSHLVGLDARDFANPRDLEHDKETTPPLSEIAAETILEEMYTDSQKAPALVGPHRRSTRLASE